jgi:hypothetical protein
MKRTKLKWASDEYAAQLRIYYREAPKWLLEHDRCEFVDPDTGKQCTRRSKDVHHKKRRKKFLLDKSTWMATCRIHHDFIETFKKLARKLGYILYE